MTGPAPAPEESIDDQWALLVNWLRHLPNGSVAPFSFPDDGGYAEHRGIDRLPVVMESSIDGGWTGADVIEPGLEHLRPGVIDALRHRLQADPTDAEVRRWAERLLVAVESDLRGLKERSRHEGETVDEGRRRLVELSFLFLEHFFIDGDPRFVNAVLDIADLRWMAVDLPTRQWVPVGSALPLDPGDHRWTDVAIVLLHAALARALALVADPTRRTDIVRTPDHLPTDLPALHELPRFAGLFVVGGADDVSDDCVAGRPAVVILCGDPGDRAVVHAAERLIERGIRVEGVVVRRLLSRDRLVDELRQDRAALARRLWNDVRSADRDVVVAWAERSDVPVVRCDDLNDDHVLGALRRIAPDAVVCMVDEPLRPEIPAASGVGVLTVGPGYPPRYSGHDLDRWPLIDGHPDHIGVAVHLAADGPGDGGLLAVHTVPLLASDDLVSLRERIEATGTAAVVAATLDLLADRIKPELQDPADGRAYFTMHPRLVEIADSRLSMLGTTLAEAEQTAS